MNDVATLISNLASEDSGLRNESAIELMDIGDPVAIEPLINAILKPENISHRGTLVYALSEFDCSRYIELLVELVLTGNFEVAIGAFGIIQDMSLNDELKNKITELLGRIKPLAEYNNEGCNELQKLIK